MDKNVTWCSREKIPPAVVVHAGARDHYQLALAQQEAGLLQALVTNVYWDKWVKANCGIELEKSRICVERKSLLAYSAMRIFPELNLHYLTDRSLSACARKIAHQSGASVFSCSYTAYEAFCPGPLQPDYRFLFQIHPHPASARQLLQEELERIPEARQSLSAEEELNRSGKVYDRLLAEPRLANGWTVASSFTAKTLIENGIKKENIHVVPYGVSRTQYPQRDTLPDRNKPFTVIFLGSLIQRKGLYYLLSAIKRINSPNIRLLLRGRGQMDPGIATAFSGLSYDLKTDMPTPEIVHDLQSSDLFVLPSLLEGFGHVILQGMACGLPVITTPNTCGPDLIEEAKHGFIVPIRDIDALVEKVQWGMDHRNELAEMGREASIRAMQYSWERFREGIRSAYRRMWEAVSLTGVC